MRYDPILAGKLVFIVFICIVIYGVIDFLTWNPTRAKNKAKKDRARNAKRGFYMRPRWKYQMGHWDKSLRKYIHEIHVSKTGRLEDAIIIPEKGPWRRFTKDEIKGIKERTEDK